MILFEIYLLLFQISMLNWGKSNKSHTQLRSLAMLHQVIIQRNKLSEKCVIIVVSIREFFFVRMKFLN